MENHLQNATIGAFAEAAGVNVETVRFYQRKGLISEPDKPRGSIRRYGSADVARVKFVKSAQRLGFSLDEIADLLTLEDGAHCADAKRLAERKLHQVREKLADLSHMEAALSGLVRACEAAREQVSCPLIASLYAAQGSAVHPATGASPEYASPAATPPNRSPSSTGMPGKANSRAARNGARADEPPVR